MNRVWAIDITDMPLAHRFVDLAAGKQSQMRESERSLLAEGRIKYLFGQNATSGS